MDVYELEEIAESVAGRLDEYMDIVGDFVLNIKNTKFPSTYSAIFGFIPKIESIRTAIFELVKIGEFYSGKILFRAICEHFLICNYIFIRFIHEKTDDIGREYFIFFGAQEELNFARSLKRRADVLGMHIDVSPIKLLKKYQPMLDNESNRSIKKIAEQFRHRNIVEYITNTLKGKKVEMPNTFLPDIIPLYSELSSFVHGGPTSLRDASLMANERLSQVALSHDAKMSLLMSLSARSLAFLLFLQEDKKMTKPYMVINNQLKSLLNDAG